MVTSKTVNSASVPVPYKAVLKFIVGSVEFR